MQGVDATLVPLNELVPPSPIVRSHVRLAEANDRTAQWSGSRIGKTGLLATPSREEGGPKSEGVARLSFHLVLLVSMHSITHHMWDFDSGHLWSYDLWFAPPCRNRIDSPGVFSSRTAMVPTSQLLVCFSWVRSFRMWCCAAEVSPLSRSWPLMPHTSVRTP